MSTKNTLPFNEIVLKSTSRCNLQPRYAGNLFVGGCDYVPVDEANATNIHGCYEYANRMWEDQPIWMPPEVVLQAARRIGEHAVRHSLKHVRIINHGGEPIMAGAQQLDDFSSTISSNINRLSPNTQVHFSVTTNGMPLDQRKIAVMQKHGYSVALSLDGDRQAHDRHRLDRQGNSTYDRVVQAATMLRESGISWRILAVIDPKNDPHTVLTSLASHKPHGITLLLPHANHSVAPDADPLQYGLWLNKAFDWYLAQKQQDFIEMPDFDSLMTIILGGIGLREAIGGRHTQELFILPNGYYQRVDTIKSTEPGAVATNMNVFEHSIDDVGSRDPGIIARRLGRQAIADSCVSCPLLKPCGGGYYPHRFKAGDRKLKIGDYVDTFTKAFRNPTIYCEAQKAHISHVVNRLEDNLNAPPGTLLQPPRKETQPEYDCPAGYEIAAPQRGDEFAITEVHARAFQQGCYNPDVGATAENLQAFVRDTTPGKGFYDRMITQWSTLTANQQPNPDSRQIVLVARDQQSQAIVGVAWGSAPHKKYFSRQSASDIPSDLINSLYVDPDYQRKGLGTALLKALMQNMGATVRLETTYDTPAVDFYEKHGFVQRPLWSSGVVGRPIAYGMMLYKLAMSCDNNPYANLELVSTTAH